MTLRQLTTDDLLAELVTARDEVAEAAHYLRNVGGVYAGRQAARLEAAGRRLDDAIANLRLTRRGDASDDLH